MSKKISGIDWTPIILIGVLGGAAWYFLKNGNPFASTANSGNNAAIDSGTASSTASTLATLATSGTNPTLSAAAASGIANDIYTQGLDGSDLATEQIVQDLTQCQNDADITLIAKYFGTKQAATSFFSTCNLLGFNCQALDLPSWIKSVCSNDEIAEINYHFQGEGMSYQI